MRCAACGATNAASADWCTQCYAPLETRLPAAGRGTGDAGDAGEEGQAGPAAEGRQPAGTNGSSMEGFRTRDGAVEWECPACGTWTVVEELRCAACGTPVSARWEHPDSRPAGPDPRFSPPWTAALLLSAVVPGAGHIGLRRFGTGLARAVLFAVWVAGGVALWRAGGAVAGAPLVLGAVALWAGSLLDLRALRAGRRELLAGRALLWLVVGVLGASIVGAFVALAGTPGAAT